MNRITILLMVAGGFLLCLAPLQAQTKLADGHAWKKSSLTERKAYLVGVSDMIAVGKLYDEKKQPGIAGTFSRRAHKGMSGSTIPAAMTAIDDWYNRNPDQLDKPVLAVLWITIAKPRLE
jgi:hypothetical protein